MSGKSGRIQFFKTTIIGGAVLLVPVVFVVMVLTEAAELMMLVAKPLDAWIPVDSVGGVALANLIVIVGLVLVCSVGGLVVRARPHHVPRACSAPRSSRHRLCGEHPAIWKGNE